MNETIQPIETISEKDHTFNYDETTASQEDVENLKERLSALNLEYPHDLNAEKIKKEYRLLLKKYHPDTRSKSLNEKEADRRFLQIKDAYENLEKYFKNN